MKHGYNYLSIFLLFADILLVFLGMYTATQLRIYLPLGIQVQSTHLQVPLQIYTFAAIFWSGSLIISKAYQPQKILRAVDEFQRVLFASAQATLFLAGYLYMTYRELSRLQFIYFYLSTTLLILLYRGLLRIYYRLHRRNFSQVGDNNRVLILGAGDLGCKVAEIILQRSRWGLDLVGFLDDDPEKQNWNPDCAEGKIVLGKVDNLLTIVQEQQVNEVYIALPARSYPKIKNIVSDIQDQAVRIKIVPDYFSLALVHARPENLGGLPVVSLRDPVIEGIPRLIKRIFDIVVSLFVLFLIWPMMVIIAGLIRKDSPGKVLFNQQRVGENGKLFFMYKFRTMVSNAETQKDDVVQYNEEGKIIYKHPEDPRVTEIGRFLRKTSLDELPQFINVLKGDMSLVGPRPEMPWLVEKYEPWQRKRFAVPQGITGWWQVNKRGDEPMHLSTKNDLYYVYNYSLWLDIKILLLTIPAVLSRKGAY